MTISQKLTIELIRYEISGVSVSEELLGSVADEVIESVYKLSLEQDVAYIVGSALSKLGLLSGDIKAAFFNEQLSSVYRYERIKHELETLSELFESEGIAFMPLKGSVIRELYPKPEMRMSCDVDILIHPEDLERAGKLVETKLAYEYYARCGHEVSWFSPSGLRLELHFNLYEQDVAQKPLLDSIWDYAELEEGSKYKYRMSNEFLVFYHVFHISKHFRTGGCGIKSFVDLWLIKTSFNYDEAKLNDLFQKAALVKFGDAAFNTAMMWFADEPGNDISINMGDFVLNSGAFGTIENQVAISQSKTGSRFKTLINRIFMPYKELKIIYPIIVKYPFLTPIFEVVRWCRIIFKDKMKKQMAIIKYNATITEEKQNEVAQLMKNLDLM